MDTELEFGSLGSDDTPVGDFSGETENTDSLANPFLQGVDEADRAVVEKYIKDWDANVTRKFQEIHENYRPYKDLGAEPEVLGNAMQLFMALNNDPAETLRLLQEGYKDYMADFDDPLEGGTHQTLPEYEGLPPAAADEIKMLREKVSKFDSFMQESMTEKQQQAEMAQLDKVLKDMHNKHGDFDEDYVLVQLANGHSPEDAIKKYNAFVDKVVGSQSKKPAPRLPSGGSLPNGQVDASKIKNPKDRKALVQQILAAKLEG